MEIVISKPFQSVQNVRTITIEQYRKRREQRRHRVAKRQLERAPLFAVEYMSAEFPNYDYDTFIADATRKTRKSKKVNFTKTPLSRQGRYPLFLKALYKYQDTKDVEDLYKAQSLRNRLFLRFDFEMNLNRDKLFMSLPSTTSYAVIQKLSVKLAATKFLTVDQWDEFWKIELQYV